MTFLFIFGIHLSALLTPGPDFFLVSAYALKFSFKEALKAAFGEVWQYCFGLFFL